MTLDHCPKGPEKCHECRKAHTQAARDLLVELQNVAKKLDDVRIPEHVWLTRDSAAGVRAIVNGLELGLRNVPGEGAW